MSPSSIPSDVPPEPAPQRPAAAAAPIRVAIAGGTALIRAALRALVERGRDFAIADDAQELGTLPRYMRFNARWHDRRTDSRNPRRL